jgi:hypothetical protein
MRNCPDLRMDMHTDVSMKLKCRSKHWRWIVGEKDAFPSICTFSKGASVFECYHLVMDWPSRTRVMLFRLLISPICELDKVARWGFSWLLWTLPS